MNLITRKIAKAISTYCEIVKLDENEFGLLTSTPVFNHTQKIKLGEEIEQKTADGRQVKNYFTFEDDKLVEQQIEEKRKVTIIRDYSDQEMIGQIIVNNVSTFQKNIFKN